MTRTASLLRDLGRVGQLVLNKGNDERDLLGSGIHGQTLLVAPGAGIVVAMCCTWPRADGDDTTSFWEANDLFADTVAAHFR